MRALAFASLVLCGCGYVGDPKPPALNIPQAVQNLGGVQRGDKLLLTFTLPALTTDGIAITTQGEIELRIGPPMEGSFDANVWSQSARLVPTQPGDGNTVYGDAPIAEFAGRDLVAAVRTAGPKGRWSQWSNLFLTSIVKPLAQPLAVQAETTAEGVRLSWQGAASTYRILRQAEKAERPALFAQAAGTSYNDDKAEFGKLYRYIVQATEKTSNGEAESEPSAPIEITPQDTFPPATPTSLSALNGVNTIELAWERSLEKDFRGYNVYRAPGDGAFEALASLVESPAYSDKTIEAGKSYRYAVSAVDQAGNESPRSQPVSITAP